MKKSEKIQLLRDSIGTPNLCRCFFRYDPNYWYFYIFGVSDKLFLGIEEDDFLLDGFQIRKISDLTKVVNREDSCSKINAENNLLVGVHAPAIDLSSWKTVFESLQPLDFYLIIQNEKSDDEDENFYIGYVTAIKDSFILFSHFDAEGEWTDHIKIPYSKITSVTFNDRYSTTWRKYLTKHDML